MQTETVRLTGADAITYAEANGLALNKHNDPTEGAREGLTVAEAKSVAREDPNLIWVDIDLPIEVIARWDAEDWDDEKMVANHYTYQDLETGVEIPLTEAQAALYAWGQCMDNLTGGSQGGTLPL